MSPGEKVGNWKAANKREAKCKKESYRQSGKHTLVKMRMLYEGENEASRLSRTRWVKKARTLNGPQAYPSPLLTSQLGSYPQGSRPKQREPPKTNGWGGSGRGGDLFSERLLERKMI